MLFSCAFNVGRIYFRFEIQPPADLASVEAGFDNYRRPSTKNAAERIGFHRIGTLTRPSRSAANFGLGVATIEVTLLARPTESP